MPTFLNPSSWLSLDPVSITAGLGRVVLFLFVAMVFLGVAARVKARKAADRFDKAVLRRAARLLVTMGLLGLLLGFFGYEHVRFLGARFWYALWLLGAAAWGFWIYRFAKGKIPAARALQKEKERKDRYLPEADARR